MIVCIVTARQRLPSSATPRLTPVTTPPQKIGRPGAGRAAVWEEKRKWDCCAEMTRCNENCLPEFGCRARRSSSTLQAAADKLMGSQKLSAPLHTNTATSSAESLHSSASESRRTSLACPSSVSNTAMTEPTAASPPRAVAVVTIPTPAPTVSNEVRNPFFTAFPCASRSEHIARECRRSFPQSMRGDAAAQAESPPAPLAGVPVMACERADESDSPSDRALI
mmetsp:Transcript_20308/g.46889  ORF Transcript_20308/g.46889 Transcript_20308/m.46889 type:complete len:223 (-) Transcript_20308:883-1551(-)